MVPKDPMLPIPYSLGAVEALCSYWNMPYNYMPRFDSADCCNMNFSPILGDHAWKGTFISMLLWPKEHNVVIREPKRQTYCSYLIRIGLTVDFNSNTSLVIYDSANNRTFGICLQRYEENATRLVRRIERNPNFASNPLFAPVILAGIMVHSLKHTSAQDYATGVNIESALGYWSSEPRNREEQDLDFMEMIQSVNSLSIKMANADYVLSDMIHSLDFLNEQLLQWPKGPAALISIELLEQARWLRDLTQNWMTASARTKGSVQSLTQTVSL